MAKSDRFSIRFSWLTALIWLLAAGGSIFLLWQVINRISAANLPLSTATPNPNQLYQTNVALLTPRQSGEAGTATQTPTPSPTTKSTPLASLPTPFQQRTITPAESKLTVSPSVPCERAAAGNPIDITIPDDSLVSPGQSFNKTWRLVNNGSCSWTTAYYAAFFYGDRMQAPESVPLNETVLPEHSVEISIDMVAPDEAGTYQGNWKLSNPDGDLFGIGPNGDSPFWVRIIVPEGPSDTPAATQENIATSTATQGTPGSPNPTGSPTSTVTPKPTPLVQVSGSLSLVPGDSIDLDILKITDDNSDTKYQQDANNYHWLAPEDDARIGVYSSQEPDFTDCQSTSMSRAPIAVESLSVGTYLCYVTEEGRSGRARFAALDTSHYTLTLDLLTWALP